MKNFGINRDGGKCGEVVESYRKHQNERFLPENGCMDIDLNRVILGHFNILFCSARSTMFLC